ncbi:MAG: DUF4177 domain-containing protein [Pleurocapsa minor GSE-CHR-MK-17-07R]|jgi:hypothetical protein|nr:DUF4177 domain-containing protein [Pleurocapsa minor GSE-CHR-MK 17-07R]
MVRWEYITTFLKADSKREEDFLVANYSWKEGMPIYTPESLIPLLNAYGAQGWELIQIMPVNVGRNADVLVADAGSGGRTWAFTYFCTFKRPLEEKSP